MYLSSKETYHVLFAVLTSHAFVAIFSQLYRYTDELQLYMYIVGTDVPGNFEYEYDFIKPHKSRVRMPG